MIRSVGCDVEEPDPDLMHVSVGDLVFAGIRLGKILRELVSSNDPSVEPDSKRHAERPQGSSQVGKSIVKPPRPVLEEGSGKTTITSQKPPLPTTKPGEPRAVTMSDLSALQKLVHQLYEVQRLTVAQVNQQSQAQAAQAALTSRDPRTEDEAGLLRRTGEIPPVVSKDHPAECFKTPMVGAHAPPPGYDIEGDAIMLTARTKPPSTWKRSQLPKAEMETPMRNLSYHWESDDDDDDEEKEMKSRFPPRTEPVTKAEARETSPRRAPPPPTPARSRKASIQDSDFGGSQVEEVSRKVSVARIQTSMSSDLKSFSGRDHNDDRAKAWYRKVKIAFARDQLEDFEKCETFASLLTGPARHWYTQLTRPVKTSWPTLVYFFKYAYCSSDRTPAQYYYSMRRALDEDPIDFLYRLNAAAVKAGLRIHDGSGEEKLAHIRQYLDTVEDDQLEKFLMARQPTAIHEVEKSLRELRRRESRIKRAEGRNKSKDRQPSRNREREREKPKRDEEYGNDKRVHFFQKHQDTSSASESSSSSDNPSDSSGSEQDSANPKAWPVRSPRPGSTRQSKEGPPPDQTMYRSSQPACSHCGSTKHVDLYCWQRITCQKCNMKGHPTDRCLRVCKCCGELHDAGECKLEEIVNQLRAWYEPSKHAGLLPAELEKKLGN